MSPEIKGPPTAEDLGWFSLAACSVLLGVGEGFLRKRFERARNENLKCWTEVSDRHSRQSQFLLRLPWARELVHGSAADPAPAED